MLRIRLNDDDTAVLVAGDDTELFLFHSVDDAINAYNHIYKQDGHDMYFEFESQEMSGSCCSIA